VQSVGGAIDQVATTDQLERIATLLPDDWLAPAARGSAEACADAVLAQFDLGVDGVIMHGASPTSSPRSSPPTGRGARPAGTTAWPRTRAPDERATAAGFLAFGL
jgi:hypothetical protein